MYILMLADYSFSLCAGAKQNTLYIFFIYKILIIMINYPKDC